MKLDQMMREATDHVEVDVVGLSQGARHQGGRIRRRRLLVSATGIVTVGACVVALSVAAGVATSGSTQESSAASGSSTVETVERYVAPPGPLDGRSTAALLEAAVLEVTDGELGSFAGQGGPGSPGGGPDTYAQLVLAPADGLGSGVVGINVQDLSILRGQPRICLTFMADCTVTQLPDGDLLRSYREAPDASDDVRLVEELLAVKRGIRVVVSSTNGFDLGANRWNVTRSEPVLDAAQLRGIALDERWSFEVPVEVAERGAALAPYEDLDDHSDIVSPSSP